MSFDSDKLFALLPALYRIRDIDTAERIKELLATDDDASSQFTGLLTQQEETERKALLTLRQTLFASGSPFSLKDAARLKELEDKRQRGPLKALLSVIAEQVAVLEEDLEQLYDDQFIETCAEWVVPYIGDLVGTRGLFYFPKAKRLSQRAQVANTLAYRRRKGTASVLEQLARDVTEWDASVVEYFQRLATTQFMNHLRPENLSFTSIRHRHFAGLQEQLSAANLAEATDAQWKAIEYLNTPFDTLARTVDVRNIESQRGKYNIPNVGLYLWRIGSYSATNTPAYKVADIGDPSVDGRRYLFNPIGKDTRLYNRTITEDEISHLAEPVNVPMPLARRVLSRYLETFYGRDSIQRGRKQRKSILIALNGGELAPSLSSPLSSPPAQLSDLLHVCDLSDDQSGAGWINHPQRTVAIDPLLGRIAFPKSGPPPKSVRVNYHYGFSAEMGGGEYGRAESFSDLNTIIKVAKNAPLAFKTIQDALNDLTARFNADPAFAGGVVEIVDNDYYDLPLHIHVPAGKKIEIRAADERRPVLLLDGYAQLDGGKDSELILNGLTIASGALRVSMMAGNELRTLRLSHCCLVPGPAPAFAEFNIPAHDDVTLPRYEPKIAVDIPNVRLEIDLSIVGRVNVADGSGARITNSIIDAGAETSVAYAAPDGLSAGGALEVVNSTVIGRVHTEQMTLASNTIFMAAFKPGESWPAPASAPDAPVLAAKLQEGCVRFSYLPPGSRVPRPFHCQPQKPRDAARVRPLFNSLRYGDADYCQLALRAAVEIKQGADDQAEMGAFHDLYQPQRISNLRARLDEYLRFGLEAGIFLAS
ncbi:MAG TPA: hypothetical protein VGC89_22420 [Pyrinomonadaceae bacterium]